MLFEIQRAVERRLTAHCWQYGVRTLFFDDFFHDLPGYRLDVGRVGHRRIGHDGCGIGVDQNDAETFLAQRLAGLGARVVKLTGLADDNRTGPDDQDTFDICTFRHN